MKKEMEKHTEAVADDKALMVKKVEQIEKTIAENYNVRTVKPKKVKRLDDLSIIESALYAGQSCPLNTAIA
jgi:hypothetical protein